ncbi:MAG: radical SAM protein [Magnetococcus sp. DMHC-8]
MHPPPFLISWNLTRRCNLRCPHCYLDAAQLDGGRDDLTTEQALAVVEQLGNFCPGAMLILTGGEPLLREDLWQIAEAATRRGLSIVLGSNGTLLSADLVPRLQATGFQGVGVSLDSIHPDQHDRFRGRPGAWQQTMTAVQAMRQQGMAFQMQFTVTRQNYEEIPRLIALAADQGARAANIFFLVCTGRGQRMTDITPDQYEQMLQMLVRLEQHHDQAATGAMMVRARCAPHIVRLAAEMDPDSALLRGATSGCIAGTGYLRITPEGDVTACPYLPDRLGNLLTTPLATLWQEHRSLHSLRQPVYHGRCAVCSHQQACGGCRARALAVTGDLMGEDPWCVHEPPAQTGPHAPIGTPHWTPAAEERLAKVPFFLRSMVKNGVERYAREKGLPSITPELMMTLRSRVHEQR